jgi:hypothetical protein
MTERSIYIAVMMGFFILSGIGGYFGNPAGSVWSDWILEKGRWICLIANLLFLIFAFRQLYIWNITVGESEIHLKRFLGSKKITLHKKDLISFDVELQKDPSWIKRPRTTIIVSLQTTQGKIAFNSYDYQSFESKIAELFSHNKEMRLQCLHQISRLKAKAGV